MKTFTLSEANDLLQEIRPKLSQIRRSYEAIDGFRDQARQAASASLAGGGMIGGTRYVQSLYQVGKLTTEIAAAGVELKDHSRGLIDFPSLREGRIVYLCWQFGDGDEIEWWHDTDAGFAGRRPI